MSTDSFNVKTPFVSIGWTKRDHNFVIKEGQTIIMRAWKWRRIGYIRKAITLTDGRIEVQYLD